MLSSPQGKRRAGCCRHDRCCRCCTCTLLRQNTHTYKQTHNTNPSKQSTNSHKHAARTRTHTHTHTHTTHTHTHTRTRTAPSHLTDVQRSLSAGDSACANGARGIDYAGRARESMLSGREHDSDQLCTRVCSSSCSAVISKMLLIVEIPRLGHAEQEARGIC